MYGSTLAASAVALFAALPAVHAGNSAIIKNYCDFDVYSWSVDANEDPSEPTIINGNGGQYSEPFRQPASGGVSIKLGLHSSLDQPLTQLEYTRNYDLWYDVSNVNCHETECPFQPHGLYLESGSGCPTVSCLPGNLTCHGAYTLWDSNWASLCCTEEDPDVTLYLCSDSSSPMGGSGGGSYGGGSSSGGSSSVESYTTTASSSHKYSAPTSTSSSTSTSTSRSSSAYQAGGENELKTTPVYHAHTPHTTVVDVTVVETRTVTAKGQAPSGYNPPQYHARHVHDHAHAHRRF